MCTSNRTHISLSSQQDNVNTTPLQPQTWDEHLQNLPLDKKWALSHLNLLDDGAPLGEAIRTGHACMVSNGSFKEQFGMAAWVFYHGKMNATLGNGKLITLGYPDDQCTYRSELSGIYGIVSTI